MHIRILALAGLTLAVAAMGLAENSVSPAPLTVSACVAPPKIDGVLDDAAWKDAARVDEFFLIGKNERVKKHQAWITFDTAWLYVAFEVDQGDLERLAPYYVNGHDDFVQRDDCVKVQFDPGGKASPWYAFKANRANTRQDRRIQADGSNEIQSWNIPWKSAVKSAGKNWTVEFAIPFCQLYPFDQLDRARINLVITTFVAKRDAQGVVVEAPVRTDFSLSPVLKTCFEPEKFTRVQGLGKVELSSAFLPLLEKAEITPYSEKDGKYSYNVALDLKNYGAKPGTLVLRLEDKTLSGVTTFTTTRLDLAKSQVTQHQMVIPAPTMEKRSAILQALDEKTGEEWQKFTFTGESTRAMELISGYLDRNYYTSEKEAVVAITVGLSENAMGKLSLLAEDEQGKVLGQAGKVAAETMLNIPLDAMPNGRHAIKIRLLDEQKRELSFLTLELAKRAPKPGCEWKVDKINRIMLNNGTPFFAMGFCAHKLATNDVATLKNLKAGGFNFLMLWEKYDAAGMSEYARLFESEGLYVMPVPDDAAAEFRGPYTLKNQAFSWVKPRSVTGLKCNLCGSGARPERNAAFREYLDYLMPDILGIVNVAKDSPANLGYFIFDEPMIAAFDQGIFGRELYDKINEADGYHPVLVNYSSEIPDDEQAGNWMDILCTDPYWVPGDPGQGIRGTINWMSMITARTFLRGAANRQVTWTIPMCNSWSACVKRGANRDEQFCQTYLAAIHGARGIMYFSLGQATYGSEVWEAASAVARQFADVLGPACVAPAVKHSIAYAKKGADGAVAPVVHDPNNGKFADIQLAVKRDPKGGYILMAANSRDYPVAIEIAVKGLTEKKISRYFADNEYPVEKESFTDKFEAYGVRAYRLPSIAEPVEIRVTSIPPENIPAPETSIAWRGGKKNKMPNPSFEEVSGKAPAYCGTSGNKIFIDTQVYKFGSQSLRIEGGYIQPTCVPPQEPGVSGKFVFSVWMKGAKPGGVEVKDLGGGAAFYTQIGVTTEWQRYEFPFTMQPKRLIFTIIPYNGTLWVDGMQVEKGAKATDFEE